MNKWEAFIFTFFIVRSFALQVLGYLLAQFLLRTLQMP